jgi:hypothetical protein
MVFDTLHRMVLTPTTLRQVAERNIGQQDLFTPLDELVEQAKASILAHPNVLFFPKENNVPGYGVVADDLRCFLRVPRDRRGKPTIEGRTNYHRLKNMYNGMNYVEGPVLDQHTPDFPNGIPPEMLAVMNTFELLSVYGSLGVIIPSGSLRIRDSHGNVIEECSKGELKAMPVEHAVSKMVAANTSRGPMHYMTKRGFHGLPGGREDLKDRIRPLNDHTKAQFILMMDRPRLHSSTEWYHGYDFDDPTKDNTPERGIFAREDQWAKMQLTKAIAHHMACVYNRNSES